MSERAFVFVYPSDSTEPLLAGQVIVIATGNGGYCRFKYAAEYTRHRDAFALDPRLLPLDDGIFESEADFEVFNVFRDASPDYWGRKVIERRLRRQGLTELDFLLSADTPRTGALAFTTKNESPITETLPDEPSLPRLLEAAERLERDEPISEELLLLLGKGSGTLGGMRPKTALWVEGEPWVAKFPSAQDRWDQVKSEFIALQLARRAKIRVPEHRLVSVGSRFVLLTKRFDRHLGRDADWLHAHYLSGLTMTGLHERDHGAGSYADLADWLRRFGSHPLEDGPEVYRRMVFNIMIGNTDDHLRNHAVIRAETGYRLSPAFDLVPQPTHATERLQALSVGVLGRLSSLENALSGAPRFGLTSQQAQEIFGELSDAVAGWMELASECDLDANTTAALRHTIRPETNRAR